MRQGDWKAVRHDPDAKNIELYNLKDDIGETKDLSSQYPAVADKLTDIMNNARTENPYFPLKRSGNSKK